MKPVYSICMCNYNMEDTLEPCLKSLLDQVDETFEIVVVDDASTDNSVYVIKALQNVYPNLRLIELQQDKKRKLGTTRNISIEHARGDYVLLHLDCDDVFAPYLLDFVEIFQQIEKSFGYPILLSGKHINIGNKAFLLRHGPYRDLYRGEDRDLWVRLAAEDAYVPFDHENFVTRLPRENKRRIYRALHDTWDHMVNYFRTGASVSSYIYYEKQRIKGMSLHLLIFKLLILIPAFLQAKTRSPLSLPSNMSTPEEFLSYRNNMKGNLQQIMSRNGVKPDRTRISEKACKIFYLDAET